MIAIDPTSPFRAPSSAAALPRYLRPRFSRRSKWHRQSRCQDIEQCSQIARSPIDQRRLGSAQGVRAELERIEADAGDPLADKARTDVS